MCGIVAAVNWGDAETLWWTVPLVSLERVRACEEVAAVSTKQDLKRVRLREVAMPLKIFPAAEGSARAQSTLQVADSATYQLLRRSL